MKKIILSIIYYISGLIPKKKGLVVFGAWNGDRISDNPKAVFDELDNTHFKCIWISKLETLEKESITKNDNKYVKRNSFKAIYYMARAEYLFVSHSFRDIYPINLSRKANIVQLWHGFPIKKIVADVLGDPGCEKLYYEKYNWFLSSSQIESERILSAFKNWGINKNNILKVGNPRNDIFSKKEQVKKIQETMRKKFFIPDDATIVIYMPTFRDKTKEFFSFSQLSEQMLKKIKDNGIYILEKQHYVNKAENIGKKSNIYNIINVSESIDSQELLVLGDILVTDFSSVYTDFIIQNKPVIHFLFDGDGYIKNNREIYGEFEEQAAGPIFYTEEEMLEYLINNKSKLFNMKKNNEILKISNEYNENNNSSKIIRIVMGIDSNE